MWSDSPPLCVMCPKSCLTGKSGVQHPRKQGRRPGLCPTPTIGIFLVVKISMTFADCSRGYHLKRLHGQKTRGPTHRLFRDSLLGTKFCQESPTSRSEDETTRPNIRNWQNTAATNHKSRLGQQWATQPRRTRSWVAGLPSLSSWVPDMAAPTLGQSSGLKKLLLAHTTVVLLMFCWSSPEPCGPAGFTFKSVRG